MICGVLYYLFFGSYGFINIIKLKRKEINLRRQKQQFLKQEEALLDSLKKIKSDTFLLEKIAREKLGMIKPGDTVIIFDDK
jgi:cell division protein FtsB